jgi:hypothetical protein
MMKMNDYDLFRSYRLKQFDTDPVIISELESQVAYMNDIARNNVEQAVDEDKLPLSYYWNGFGDITDAITEILERRDADRESPEYRRMRMRGMLDACNTILCMIEDEDFHKPEHMED